ncbi:unnamed protein product [Paramecium octaurelia]|uniref:RBR-type E3 ubiquitin transferase n=1 Tax=Paramecium octaurelia TaxID=43137 RepID=A0A8S1TE19_PAROT|nr:unnamed protein product [Paramecium octaurelia]
MYCQICFIDKLLIRPGDCSHEFCKECIITYLKEAINTGSVFKITCPSCSMEYNALIIKQFCEDLYPKYLELKQKAIITCSVCKENLKTHNCGSNVCKKCGEIHDGECSQRCPNCLIPIEKISGCNHMVCKCKYEFCWICKGKFNRYHYRLWNLFGCPIPGSMMKNVKPLRHPTLLRYIMVLPKIMAFILIFCILLLIYPFFCFILTFKYHYQQFTINKYRLLLVFLFPLTYLMHFFYKGIFAVQKKLHSLS